MKLNFFKAWANYRRYCLKAGLTVAEMATIQEFAVMFNENKASGHENCNYTEEV